MTGEGTPRSSPFSAKIPWVSLTLSGKSDKIRAWLWSNGRESAVPIYEYQCEGCRRRVSLLIKSISNPGLIRCPRCGSRELTRLLSRFATPKSEEARLESLADPGHLGDLDENDPKSLARWMKRMGKEMGDDLGEDFGSAVDEAMEEEAHLGREGGENGGDSFD